MTDLRTKIAAVLYRLYSHGSWEQLLEIEREAWRDDADAVIRELGLEREHWQYGDGHTMGVRYRYVTEWETDQ